MAGGRFSPLRKLCLSFEKYITCNLLRILCHPVRGSTDECDHYFVAALRWSLVHLSEQKNSVPFTLLEYITPSLKLWNSFPHCMHSLFIHEFTRNLSYIFIHKGFFAQRQLQSACLHRLLRTFQRPKPRFRKEKRRCRLEDPEVKRPVDASEMSSVVATNWSQEWCTTERATVKATYLTSRCYRIAWALLTLAFKTNTIPAKASSRRW